MLPLVLKEAVEQVASHVKSAPPAIWVHDVPTEGDYQHIVKEGSEVSKFDPLRLKQTMLEAYQQGRARLICRRCAYAKVLVIVHPEYQKSIPWTLFGKIFRAVYKPSQGTWRVVIFANPTPRVFPPAGQQPGPAEVNGGYTYPGRADSIVLYRLEECARVLLHELLHAAGTDDFNNGESIRETLTESWAEVFLIAIQANGSLRKARKLWESQAQWIVDQETKLRQMNGVQNSNHYAYRYTVGRRRVLEGWGFTFPSTAASSPTSLRFTAPVLTL
jgi:hypothetical protein